MILPHTSIKLKTSSGFTLLEVIIAVSIMAFISIFTARMISQGVKARTKIQADIDARSGITAAIQLMTQDLTHAFNYRDINTELFNAAQKQRKDKKLKPTTPTPPVGQTPPTPPTPPTAPPQLSPDDEAEFKTKPLKPYSNFYGEANKVDFTTIESHRSTKNGRDSDQVEVGYYIDTCTSRIKRDQSSDCLWRRFSPYIDANVKEGGKKLVVLENVKSLTFRYLGPGHLEEWSKTWVSENGEEVMKGAFPVAVEITLVVNDSRFTPPKELAMTVVAPVAFPNNKEEQPNNAVK